MDLKGSFLASVRAAWTSTRIAFRIGLGVAGIALMSGGLLLIEPYGLLAVGIPLVLIGLAFVVRAIF
ncbi:MAG TPA: hypothetical protein VGK61_05090 [Planctomycetota bacterium]|jgi:hypothetical protein